ATLALPGLESAKKEPLVHAICSVKEATHLVIRTEKVGQRISSWLQTFNLNTKKRLWKGQVGEEYLFTGGIDIGIGWIEESKIVPWNRNLALRRINSYDEATLPYIATYQQVGDHFMVRCYDLRRQALLASYNLPSGTRPLYCESGASGNLQIITS